jgi:hypothetical protein
MAKKAKVRKGAKPKEEKEGQVLGTVSIPVQASVDATSAVAFNELLIEWACLGLSEEPDTVTEISGNSHLLDPKRSPRTDEEGLHVFFDPPLSGGKYGFQFVFLYNEAAEARSTADAPTDEELAKEAAKEAE